MEAELNSFLMTSTIDVDHLASWKVHSVDFPKLRKLSWKFLYIRATSSSFECLVLGDRSCVKEFMYETNNGWHADLLKKQL